MSKNQQAPTCRRYSAEPKERAVRMVRQLREKTGEEKGTIGGLPDQLRQSLTWDQCAEMAQHAQLRVDTGLPVFFCDPQSP